MEYQNSYEFFKKNNRNVMAAALCHITLDNLANNIGTKGKSYTKEIQEIEVALWGISATGNMISKDFEEKLMELRGLLIDEFHLNDSEEYCDKE